MVLRPLGAGRRTRSAFLVERKHTIVPPFRILTLPLIRMDPASGALVVRKWREGATKTGPNFLEIGSGRRRSLSCTEGRPNYRAWLFSAVPTALTEQGRDPHIDTNDASIGGGRNFDVF